MDVTVLSENTRQKNSKLKTEHGLSLLVKKDNNKILFDTGGPKGTAIQNAKTLNLDISQIDAVVISHGHNDHTGGLLDFFKLNDNAPIYLKKEALNPHYAEHNSKKKFIGMDKRIAKDYYERLKFIDKTTEIFEKVFIIPQIIKKFPIPSSNRYLLSSEDNKLIKDQFHHELFMTVQENDMTLLTGCGHSGIINIVNTVKEFFHQKKIRTIIGGLHFQAGELTSYQVKDKEIRKTANWLKSEGVERIYTGHCTGRHGFKIMQSVFDDGLEQIYSGKKILL